MEYSTHRPGNPSFAPVSVGGVPTGTTFGQEVERDLGYAEKHKRQAAADRNRQRHRFQCQGCSHESRASDESWPQCNACQAGAPIGTRYGSPTTAP